MSWTEENPVYKHDPPHLPHLRHTHFLPVDSLPEALRPTLAWQFGLLLFIPSQTFADQFLVTSGGASPIKAKGYEKGYSSGLLYIHPQLCCTKCSESGVPCVFADYEVGKEGKDEVLRLGRCVRCVRVNKSQGETCSLGPLKKEGKISRGIGLIKHEIDADYAPPVIPEAYRCDEPHPDADGVPDYYGEGKKWPNSWTDFVDRQGFKPLLFDYVYQRGVESVTEGTRMPGEHAMRTIWQAAPKAVANKTSMTFKRKALIVEYAPVERLQELVEQGILDPEDVKDKLEAAAQHVPEPAEILHGRLELLRPVDAAPDEVLVPFGGIAAPIGVNGDFVVSIPVHRVKRTKRLVDEKLAELRDLPVEPAPPRADWFDMDLVTSPRDRAAAATHLAALKPSTFPVRRVLDKPSPFSCFEGWHDDNMWLDESDVTEEQATVVRKYKEWAWQEWHAIERRTNNMFDSRAPEWDRMIRERDALRRKWAFFPRADKPEPPQQRLVPRLDAMDLA